MKNNCLKCSFLLSCTFLGAVIGAGFASGREIAEFFLPFGKWGILGLFTACFVLAFCFYAVTKTVAENNIKNTYEYLEYIANPFFAKIIYIIIYAFSFVLLCAMTAGSGALFKQMFSLPYVFGAVLMCTVCGVIFYRNIYGILNANAYLAPTMVFGIIYIGIVSLSDTREVFGGFNSIAPLFVSSLVYASYNSVGIISVFCEMGDMLGNKRTPVLSAVMSGIMLFAVSLVLFLVLLKFKDDALTLELPLLKITGNASLFYTVLMFFAMLTTAVSSLFSLIKFCTNTFCTGKNTAVYICFFAFLCSLMGFSEMVSKVYPVFGYIGLFLIVYSGVKFVFEKCNKKSKSLKMGENTQKQAKNIK